MSNRRYRIRKRIAQEYRVLRNTKGGFKIYAYGRKAEYLGKLCELLSHTDYIWGWGPDSGVVNPAHVLYVELPEGQVSFHVLRCGTGPDYLGTWDGEHASEERILQYSERILQSGS